MDSLTECNDGGASRGELEYVSEDFRIKLPAIVPVLKEVPEGDRGGVDPAGAGAALVSADSGTDDRRGRRRRLRLPDLVWAMGADGHSGRRD